MASALPQDQAPTPAAAHQNPPVESSNCGKITAIVIVTTILALGVIAGALLMVHHYNLIELGPLTGPLNTVSQYLGQFYYLPLAVAGGLSVVMLLGVAINQCCCSRKVKLINPWTLNQSVTLQRPQPRGQHAF